MQLDSARELKGSLARRILPSLAAPVLARKLGVSARRMDTLGRGPATLALGITPRKKTDFSIAVRIQNRALDNGPQVDTIRRHARGEIDIRYVGPIAKHGRRRKQVARRQAPVKPPWHQAHNRPLRIGGSIGHFNITAGTHGCFVRDAGDARTYLLSNNHVLADENRARPADPILQPGPFDRGHNPDDAVATLARFVRLTPAGPNRLDCALALLDDDSDYDYQRLRGIGKLAGLAEGLLDHGTRVAKLGRTTGKTAGKVTAFELDNVVVAYDIGNLRFDDQIEMEGAQDEPFSRGGDSGALIVNEHREGVGLLFAGSDHGGSNGLGLTYGNPLGAVLHGLMADLLY